MKNRKLKEQQILMSRVVTCKYFHFMKKLRDFQMTTKVSLRIFHLLSLNTVGYKFYVLFINNFNRCISFYYHTFKTIKTTTLQNAKENFQNFFISYSSFIYPQHRRIT